MVFITRLQRCRFEYTFFLGRWPKLLHRAPLALTLLHYRDWRHGRLHSPRAERMAEKSPVTPRAISVQTKRKPPLDLAIPLATPTPFPFMWRTGTANERSDPRSMITYPDRRSAS